MPPGQVNDPKSAAMPAIGKLRDLTDPTKQYYFQYEKASDFLADGDGLVTFDLSYGTTKLYLGENELGEMLNERPKRFAEIAQADKAAWYAEWKNVESDLDGINAGEQAIIDDWKSK